MARTMLKTWSFWSLSCNFSRADFPTSSRMAFAELRNLSDRVIETNPATASSPDRKSTRLNSSHGYISYAVFCLKKKKTTYMSGSKYDLACCHIDIAHASTDMTARMIHLVSPAHGAGASHPTRVSHRLSCALVFN